MNMVLGVENEDSLEEMVVSKASIGIDHYQYLSAEVDA